MHRNSFRNNLFFDIKIGYKWANSTHIDIGSRDSIEIGDEEFHTMYERKHQIFLNEIEKRIFLFSL